MKKRISAFVLALTVVIAGIGIGTTNVNAAEPKVFYDENLVKWIGNTDELPTTFDSLFDEDGLKKVAIYESKNSDKAKYGIVNKKGEFVAPPIYDEIKVYYADQGIIGTYFDSYQLSWDLFLFGYTQVKRDGKMGLLNKLGEEVVPCKYDAVGMPSEGICRVFKDGKLGYYNLNKKKEIVAPKYPVPEGIYFKSSPTRCLNETYLISDTERDDKGFKKSIFDFNGGYALVPLSDKSFGITNLFVLKAQLIDPDGKEILPGKDGYFCKLNLILGRNSDMPDYPQTGAYLVNMEKSKEDYFWHDNKKGDCASCKKMHIKLWKYGLVTKEKVLIKPKYTAGIIGSRDHKFHGPDTRAPLVYLKDKVMIVPVEAKDPERASVQLVDFTGKKIFDFSDEVAYFTQYYPEVKAFYDFGKDRRGNIVTSKGKYKGFSFDKYDDKGRSKYAIASYVVNDRKSDKYVYDLKADKKLFKLGDKEKFGNLKALPYKDLTVGIFTKSKKYSLVDIKAKKVLVDGCDKIEDYTYNAVPYFLVSKASKYGIYDKNGKEIIPCKYKTISRLIKAISSSADKEMYHDRGKTLGSEYYVILTDTNGIQSLYNLKTKKTVLKLSKGQTFKLDATDSKLVSIDKKNVIGVKNSDKSTSVYNIETGKQVYNTTASSFNTGNYVLGGVKQISLGNKKYSYIGTDGHPVYFAKQPGKEYLDEVFEYPTDSLVFVKSGKKIGYIPSNLMAHPTLPKNVGETKNVAYGTQAGFVNAVTTAEYEAAGNKPVGTDEVGDIDRGNTNTQGDSPVIISAKSTKEKTVTVEWKPYENAAYYEVAYKRKTVSGDGSSKIYPGTDTSVTQTLGFGNVTYVLRIRALDSNKKAISVWSGWTEVMIK